MDPSDQDYGWSYAASSDAFLVDIIKPYAKAAYERILPRVRRFFQSERECLLSGSDSSLRDWWDELCVQVQHDESDYWESYLDTARQVIAQELAALPRGTVDAMWLLTEQGWEWLSEHPSYRLEPASFDEDVIEHILRELLELAGSWSNARITRWIDNAY